MEYDNSGKGGAYPHLQPPQYTPPQYTPANINYPQPPMQPPPMHSEMHPQMHSAPVISHQPVHVVHVQHIVPTQVGTAPTLINCPSCKHDIMTRMEYESNSRTHLIALGLCLLGCWPCVLIPYCTESCQSGNHYCPKCGAYIGTYQG